MFGLNKKELLINIFRTEVNRGKFELNVGEVHAHDMMKRNGLLSQHFPNHMTYGSADRLLHGLAEDGVLKHRNAIEVVGFADDDQNVPLLRPVCCFQLNGQHRRTPEKDNTLHDFIGKFAPSAG
jgi:hypothetical protein